MGIIQGEISLDTLEAPDGPSGAAVTGQAAAWPMAPSDVGLGCAVPLSLRGESNS